ncbi:hypothetical protein MBLNU230_g3138t1 [Neophaeotheca triangularis]
MAYSDDAVKAKLSALNESQDSIVTVAQWIMFHRRHADKTAALWLDRLRESNTPKRLNLIYLANEVVQQSRARSKQDFLLAFEPLIADATAMAYKGASQEVQGKLRRVVEVWRQRTIFDLNIQANTEKRLDELDKSRGGKANGGGKLGGSLFGGSAGSVPPELEGISKSLTATTKAETSAMPLLNTANTEHAKMTDPNTPLPTPPVHAARLSALMRNLASAQGAVEASIKAREELVAGLETLINTNRSKLTEEKTNATDLAMRRENIENRKREVEDGIMRGLSNPSTPNTPNFSPPGLAPLTDDAAPTAPPEPDRPDFERFTPPPPEVESFTPPHDPPAPANDSTHPSFIGDAAASEALLSAPTGAEPFNPIPPSHEQPPPEFQPANQTPTDAAAAAKSFLETLNLPPVPSVDQGDLHAPQDPRLKRRKYSHKSGRDDEGEAELFANGAGEGMDEEGIAAMLGQ